MTNGWIKLHRKSLESAVFGDALLWQVFTYCLMRAGHKEYEVIRGGNVQLIKPGEFITGRFAAAEVCNMNPNTWYKKLKILEGLGMIKTESSTKDTLIKVMKWQQYQEVASETVANEMTLTVANETIENCNNKITAETLDNKGDVEIKNAEYNNSVTTKEQQRNTNKNIKNIYINTHGQIEAKFDAFWEAYPRKVNKQEAMRKFKKRVSDSNFKKVMQGLKFYKDNEWRNRDTDYIPHAATWLNQERYEDAAQVARPEVPKRESATQRMLNESR